jgi:hypothetical protein
MYPPQNCHFIKIILIQSKFEQTAEAKAIKQLIFVAFKVEEQKLLPLLFDQCNDFFINDMA